jgi:hypothetical protein
MEFVSAGNSSNFPMSPRQWLWSLCANFVEIIKDKGVKVMGMIITPRQTSEL